MVEHLVYTEGVEGSNPPSPTSPCKAWLATEEGSGSDVIHLRDV